MAKQLDPMTDLDDLQEYIPIPGLTDFFKMVAKNDRTLLETYLAITTPLRFLNNFAIAAYEGAYSDSDSIIVWFMMLAKYYWPEDSSPPLFEFVNPVVFYNLVSANKDIIAGHPYNTYGRASDKPRRIGEIWLIGCALHAEADTDGTLEPILSEYADLTPNLLDEELIENYYEELVTLTSHPLPEMALMFRGMLEQCNGNPKTFTADHLSFLLREFMRVGLNTVDSWQLCRSSDVLLNQIGCYKVSQSVTRAFAHRTENPFADSPAVVRWSLLGVQFGDVVDRLICGVIPSLT